MKKYKKIIAVLLSVAMGCGLLETPFIAVGANQVAGLNNAKRHVVCEEISDAAKSYYSGNFSIENLMKLSGAKDHSDSYAAMNDNQLYDALQNLMQSTLNQDSIPTYSGFAEKTLAYYWNMTDTSEDVDNSKSSHFVLFYSDCIYEYPGGKFPMNREHIWPKSRASYHELNGGSDLHHLRPSEKTVNEVKSDHMFGYVDEVYSAGYSVGTIDDNEVYKVHSKNDVFEPKDDVKGDVARILLYVYCCWGQPNLYSDVDEENLPVGDPDEITNTGVRVISDLNTLLTWCEEDPVDTWEMNRNDLAENVQGNRNVFIDYPELAWKLFGEDIPAGMQTPTHKGCNHKREIIDIDYTSCMQSGTVSEKCSICGNIRTMPTPPLGHLDKDSNGHCDMCSDEVLGTFKLCDNIAEGDHIIIYHPSSGKALATIVNSSGRLESIDLITNNSKIVALKDTAVFEVKKAQDGGYYFICNGKYLTTPEKGSKLLWSDTVDDYCVWNIIDVGDGSVYIVNATAGNYYGNSAIEFFNNVFTTYSNPNSDAFQFQMFKEEQTSEVTPEPENESTKGEAQPQKVIPKTKPKTTGIKKKKNTLTVKTKKVTLKYRKIKKKKQIVALSKFVKKKGQGTMTYKLSAVKKGKKSFRKFFKVNAKNGKLTVKRGLKKGTYKVKILVKASGNKYYMKSSVKKMYFKLKVK